MRTLVVVFLSLVVLQVIADNGESYLRHYNHKGRMFDRIVLGAKGNVKFFSGDSRFSTFAGEAQDYIHQEFKSILNLAGSEEFTVKRQESDWMGNSHIVLQQKNRGLEVDGGEIILHHDSNNTIYAVTASVLPDIMEEKPLLKMQPEAAIRRALAGHSQFVKTQFDLEADAELVYLMFNDEGFLAYRAVAVFQEEGIDMKVTVYISADDGSLLLENPHFMNALNRAVYSANQRTSLPGTLKRSEGQSANADQQVNQAYDNSGICYEFYKKTFNRDSIDGRGKTLISTVHYSVKYNNAFWDGTQMVYGDGDGINFSDFAGDLSVVCHELTHAVTSYTANLRYQGESGALNEALSDIMGAASTIFRDKSTGPGPNTWHIGHDCYLDGEALRYMDNPILDGVSYDWFPTRYRGTSDNGGVHMNSGIANLAFVLMTQGGVHPQQKSSIWVELIGISQAQQIFYSALTQYMTTSTTFAGARAATETAAQVLYGNVAEKTVNNAWTAVGV
jgi:vibriolysin